MTQRGDARFCLRELEADARDDLVLIHEENMKSTMWHRPRMRPRTVARRPWACPAYLERLIPELLQLETSCSATASLTSSATSMSSVNLGALRARRRDHNQRVLCLEAL